MHRVRTAISGVLGSLGIALLVVGLSLAMENTAAAKDEDGNFDVCFFCANHCDVNPMGGCFGYCSGLGCNCGCRRNRAQACVCKTFP